MKIFAERLKILRELSKKSQKEIADLIHSTEASIRNYEKESRTPDIETLNSLADCFGVTSDYLIGRSPYPVINMKVDKICDYTGLSPFALNLLHTLKKTNTPKILNIMLSDKMWLDFYNYCENINGCASFDNSMKFYEHKFNQLANNKENKDQKALQNKRKALLHYYEELENLKAQYEYKAQQYTSKLLNCFYNIPADNNIPPSKTYTMAMEVIKCDENSEKANSDFPSGGFISAIDILLDNFGDEDVNS